MSSKSFEGFFLTLHNLDEIFSRHGKTSILVDYANSNMEISVHCSPIDKFRAFKTFLEFMKILTWVD